MENWLEREELLIGTDNINNGTKASVEAWIIPVTDNVAIKNPAKSAPESPINIFAGLKL